MKLTEDERRREEEGLALLEKEFFEALADLERRLGQLPGEPDRRIDLGGALRGRRPVDFVRGVARAFKPTAAFRRLQFLGRLDLSLEALVLDPRWDALFDATERARARQHLKLAGYRLPMPPDPPRPQT